MGGGLFGDQRNWVVGTDDPCTDGEEAITTTGTLRIPANEKSHNPNRAVIELCDTLFRDRGYAMRLDDISIVRDLQGLPGGIRTFKLMPSATLLHEVCRFRSLQSTYRKRSHANNRRICSFYTC